MASTPTPFRDNQVYSQSAEKEVWRDRHGREIGEEVLPGLLKKENQGWQKLFRDNAASLRVTRRDSRLVLNAGATFDGYENNTDDAFMDVCEWPNGRFEITTGNLVGRMSFGKGKTIEVGSRFGDDFLRFIISGAEGFLELKDFGASQSGDGWEWLLSYLWTIRLQAAAGRLGIPKEYVCRTERSARPRGTLDPLDCTFPKTPGKWLARTREHSSDTLAARLFIAAYEASFHIPGVASMGFLSRVRGVVDNLRVATAWSPSVRLDGLCAAKPFRNPFYRDYDEVIDLSKRILRRHEADMNELSQTGALLFDVSMLFEYFIRNRLRRAGLPLIPKETDALTIPHGGEGNGGRRRLIPDIVIDQNGRRMVYDVKYKAWDGTWGVSREDLFQLHTYIGQHGNETEVASCGFVYPIKESDGRPVRSESVERDGGRIYVIRDEIRQCGRDMPFNIVFLPVPAKTAKPDGKPGEDKRMAEKWAEVFLNNCKALDAFFTETSQQPRCQ